MNTNNNGFFFREIRKISILIGCKKVHIEIHVLLSLDFVIFVYHFFQAIPGPGKYDIKGMFDPEPPKVNTEGVEVEHPPFMSQAKVRHVP